MKAVIVLSGVLACAVGQCASAALIAGWTFEDSQPNTKGPHPAELGAYAGSSFASRFAASSPVQVVNSAGNGSAFAFDTRRWVTNDYYEFTTSTLGYESITIEWDQTRNPNGPSSFKLTWSTDGSVFNDLLTYTVDSVNWSPGGSPNPASHFGEISVPASVDDEMTVYFRLVNLTGSSPPGQGTKVDNVFIWGVPIPDPGALALLGAAGLIVVRRRRS